MPETFKCPSCSAPLDFEGSTFQKCTFCGGSIIVPAEVFTRPKTINLSDINLSALSGKALKITEIQRLVAAGRKIDAIKVFRETFGTGLKEAKEAVERIESGKGIDLSAMRINTDGWRINDHQLKTAKKIGYTVGGSILFSTALIAVFTVAVLGVVLFFVFSAVRNQSDSMIDSGTVAGTESRIAAEILRIGGDGNGPGKFTDNRNIAVDGEGNIYSGNYEGGVIQVFDATGKFLREIFTEKGPVLKSLAVDRNGSLYIANPNGIFEYSGKTGELIKELRINRVESLAATRDQKLIALVKKDLKIFDKDLKQVSEVKNVDKLANASLGLEEITVAGDGSIFAIDRKNGDICKFSAEGKFLNRFSSGGRSPNGVAVNSSGHIFVSDGSAIFIFDENGKEIGSFKTNQAFGIVFDQSDDVFVASRPFVVKYKINLQK